MQTENKNDILTQPLQSQSPTCLTTAIISQSMIFEMNNGDKCISIAPP